MILEIKHGMKCNFIPTDQGRKLDGKVQEGRSSADRHVSGLGNAPIIRPCEALIKGVIALRAVAPFLRIAQCALLAAATEREAQGRPKELSIKEIHLLAISRLIMRSAIK